VGKESEMKLQILGTGCAKCKQLLANAEQAVVDRDDCQVEKIEDIREIMKFRVLATPALAIDGVVKAAGRVLSPDEIKRLIES
jgi:small redox-active disulfide protein 2